MKKFIRRFWGVGLVLIIISTLFIAASPVSAADPLRWESKTGGPSTTFYALTSKYVSDFAVSPDTKTIYGACGTGGLLLSTNGGTQYTDITSRLPLSPTTVFLVAMAPDDPNTVVVVGNTTVAISVNGGATFTDMALSGSYTITSLEISPLVTGGVRYIAVTGTTATGGVIMYFNYGSGVGAWNNAVTYFSTKTTGYTDIDSVLALAFSPNFASDYMAMAVSVTNNATFNGARLHALTFNTSGSFTGGWDTAIAAGYPVTLGTATSNMTLASGSIALGPDFMGGDETLRMAFVGLASSTYSATVDGIWRCNDTAAARQIYSDVGINSVTYDGTNLVAGAYATNVVYHSTDPLTSTPTLTGARSYKRIGVDDTGVNDRVKVMYVGSTVYGSKTGKGGAISKSTDDGVTWNDFTLINQAITYIDDVMPSADGSTWYVSIRDANTSSVYRMSPMQRVLCTDVAVTTYDFKLRGLASDANVVYAFDGGGTTLFYSADGGVSRWQQRLNVPAAIADLAVESANVIYIGSGVNVYKSINNGFTWNTPVNTTSTTNIYSLTSIGENKIIAGLTSGAAWSTDGGATWAKNGPPFGSGGTLVTASGLGTGDFIFAASINQKDVYRCELGPSNPANEFKSMGLTTQTAAETTKGMAYASGILYVISQNGTLGTPAYLNSILTPTMAPGGVVSSVFWRTEYVSNASNNAGTYQSGLTPTITPYDLKASTSTGKITLWVASAYSSGGAYGVYYLDDTLALTGPKITGPADKFLVQTNSVNGYPLAFNLTWSRASLATSYEVQVALDSGFVSKLISGTSGTVNSPAPEAAMVISGAGFNPGATYYWKVRALAPMSSAWSETRSFTMQPIAAAVPVISSPVNGATIQSQSPAFSWTPVTGTTQYEFQLSTTPTFGTTVLTDTPASTGTLVPVTIKLEQGKQYFWRVRASQPVQGDWSAVANFIVATPAPSSSPPVVITQVPAPTITIPPASPVPAITLNPPATEQIAPTYIWAIIIIGAILVIAVIVLIVRTRRSV